MDAKNTEAMAETETIGKIYMHWNRVGEIKCKVWAK